MTTKKDFSLSNHANVAAVLFMWVAQGGGLRGGMSMHVSSCMMIFTMMVMLPTVYLDS